MVHFISVILSIENAINFAVKFRWINEKWADCDQTFSEWRERNKKTTHKQI